MSHFILLHPLDNVLVCIKPIKPGQTVDIDGNSYTLPNSLTVGHKVARSNIGAGEKIIKHGVPIGSAVRDIHVAEHVHNHNIKSDYIASHSRDDIYLNENDL